MRETWGAGRGLEILDSSAPPYLLYSSKLEVNVRLLCVEQEPQNRSRISFKTMTRKFLVELGTGLMASSVLVVPEG